MDTNVLCEFTELAKRLNFTETARVMNMSQPTLSKHIAALEKELRVLLFVRSGSSLSLTRAGAELLPAAYRIIEAQHDFMNSVRQLKTPPPRLSIGGLVKEERVTEILGELISKLSREYGVNFLEVKSCHHRPPLACLNDSSIDIVFDYASPDEFGEDDTIGAVHIETVPWIALVSKSHRLATRSVLEFSELKGETFIKIEGTHVSEAWRFVERTCTANGFTPTIRRHYSMSLTDLLPTTANLGNDVLVLGANFVQRVGAGIDPFCTQIPITGTDVALPISALYRIDNPSPILDEAVDVIKKAARNRERHTLLDASDA